MTADKACPHVIRPGRGHRYDLHVTYVHLHGITDDIYPPEVDLNNVWPYVITAGCGRSNVDNLNPSTPRLATRRDHPLNMAKSDSRALDGSALVPCGDL